MMVDDKKDGLALVMERNVFYRDAYRRVIFILVSIFVLNCVLAVGIVYKYLNPPAPQYFATTPEGRIIKIHALTDPAVTNEFVLQKSAAWVRQLFSFDYIHYQKQLQDASDNFTANGWNDFFASLKKSNLLTLIANQKMVASATLTAAPQIIQQSVVSGHYAWKVEMPLLVTYTNGTNTQHQMYNLTLIVMRMPVKDYPQRIAINNFIVEVPEQQ